MNEKKGSIQMNFRKKRLRERKQHQLIRIRKEDEHISDQEGSELKRENQEPEINNQRIVINQVYLT